MVGMHRVLEIRSKRRILGILNGAFSELLKVKNGIYSHLLSQHAKDVRGKC